MLLKIKNLISFETKLFTISVISIILGMYKANNAQANDFMLNQKNFPNNGEIIGFFSGEDKNNDGFLTAETFSVPEPLENELTSFSFEYISKGNITSFVIDSEIVFIDNFGSIAFSYDLVNNELDFINLQAGLSGLDNNESGEFGYFYNKNTLPFPPNDPLGSSIGLVFKDAPNSNSDISFDLALVSSIQTNEYTSLKSLLTVAILGLIISLIFRKNYEM